MEQLSMFSMDLHGDDHDDMIEMKKKHVALLLMRVLLQSSISVLLSSK